MMNRLRGDRVIVDLSELNNQKKEDYKQVGAIYVPDNEPKEAMLTKGIAVRVGHMIHPSDIKEGQIVHVKKMQGDKLYEDQDLYIFRESAIYGTD